MKHGSGSLDIGRFPEPACRVVRLRLSVSPDPEVGGIVLVLVVVLVLDPWDPAPKKEPDPSAITLFHNSDREICGILEDEHEHDFLTSAFRFGISGSVKGPMSTINAN